MSSSTTPTKTVQEFNIRVPKNVRKNYHLMAFNASLNVDFATWQDVKLERENGAETAKKHRPKAQPWVLQLEKNTAKKFKGTRHGGFDENAAFYALVDTPDGATEAYRIKEYYKFQPIQRYTTLSAEEAEHEFGRRNKILNYFNIMMRKRLKRGDKEEKEYNDKNVDGKKSELKIREMVEWIDSNEESDSDEGESESEKNEDSVGDKKSKKGKEGRETKVNPDIDIEAFEQLDDGDEDEKEIDYNTSSSEE
ncbi:general transcription factor IIF subunit 1-like [Teleopsis dalmanni]|uniref:general transcription factor IIF subunit 1-like n=1 Tax=Teleopsis dalmanni TaxID=139649 RepID=UPI0018CECC88|nr:general transcription factor IIF subunit 1-like [Teleopsis dalmanni]